MKSIRNKTRKPLKISVPGGKFLHLGPAKTGQVSDQAAEAASLLRLIKSGDIELLGDEASGQTEGGTGSAIHSATHGHPQTTMVLPKGNR